MHKNINQDWPVSLSDPLWFDCAQIVDLDIHSLDGVIGMHMGEEGPCIVLACGSPINTTTTLQTKHDH